MARVLVILILLVPVLLTRPGTWSAIGPAAAAERCVMTTEDGAALGCPCCEPGVVCCCSGSPAEPPRAPDPLPAGKSPAPEFSFVPGTPMALPAVRVVMPITMAVEAAAMTSAPTQARLCIWRT